MRAGTGYLGGYRDVACVCKDGVRKVKTRLELNLARELEDNNEGFLYGHTGTKGKAKVWAHCLGRLGT